jgi:hypothetical protein
MSQLLVAKILPLNISSSGDNTVISAPSSGGIEVWQMSFTAAGAVNVTFKNGTTAQSGAYIFTGNGASLTWQYTEMPWVRTDPGNNFVINLSAAVGITGQVFYTLG